MTIIDFGDFGRCDIWNLDLHDHNTWVYTYELLCVIVLFLGVLEIDGRFPLNLSQRTWNHIVMRCVPRNSQGGPTIPGTQLMSFQWCSPRLYPAKTNYTNPNLKSKIIQPSPLSHRIHGAAILMLTWIPSIYSSHVSINIPAPWILWVLQFLTTASFPSFLPPECINASTASSSSNGSFASRWPTRDTPRASDGEDRGSGSKPLCMLRCGASGCWYHL